MIFFTPHNLQITLLKQGVLLLHRMGSFCFVSLKLFTKKPSTCILQYSSDIFIVFINKTCSVCFQKSFAFFFMALRFQRGNLSNSWISILKISKKTSAAK